MSIHPRLAALCALSLTACAVPTDDALPAERAPEPLAELGAAPGELSALATASGGELSALATISTVRPFVGGAHGLALAHNNRLYLSNSFGAPVPRQVYYLDPPYTGAYVATGITGTTPSGLMSHGRSLFVCDVNGGTVREFDSSHNLIRRWSANTPWNLTALPNGDLLTVSNSGHVQQLLPSAKTAVTLFSGLDAPFGIAATADGTFWVSEQGAVSPGAVTRRDTAGQILESIPYAWNNPEGLLVDREGALWIAETGRGEILRYQGGVLEVVGAGLGLPVLLTQKKSDGPYCQNPGTETIFANSANNPASLYAIDPCP